MRPFTSFLLAATVLGGAPCSQAESPRAVIDAPAQATVGDLVVLSAEGSHASDFAWRLANSEKTFLPVDGGRRCVFSSGSPGKFVFVLAVACGDQVAVALHTIDVVTPEPPNPDPSPVPPTPDPDLPPGKFNLAKLARDWALTTVSLDPSQRKETARSLAASFSSLAAAIAAGTVTDPAQILAQTLASNQQALGDRRQAWKEWGEKLAKELEALHGDGSLRSAESYAIAWREIALGLEGVNRDGR